MALEFLLPVSAAVAVVCVTLHVLYLTLQQHLKDFRVQTWSQVEAKGFVRLYFVAAMQAVYKNSGVFYPFFPWEKLVPVSVDETEKYKDNDGNNNANNKLKTTSVQDILERYPGTKAIFITPPEEESTVTNCRMDHPRLQMYRRCISQNQDTTTQHALHRGLPPCFMMSYFNKLIIGIGSSNRARARVLGGVHVRQQITIHRDLSCLLHDSFR